jgi:tetratricopeptide (TPR) repeat protein
MHVNPRILVATALAALVTASAAAQAPTRLRAMPDAVAPSAPVDSLHVAAVLRSADALAASGRLREAIRSLRSVASEQAEAGDYAGESLRRLANLQYGIGDEFQAANTLDELADAAQTFGDPPTRLRALFDAALVYQGLKLYDRVPEHVRQAKLLLKSPAIDESLRSEIASRMLKG